MFQFNLKKAAIYIALRWSYVFSFAYPFKKGFLILLLMGGAVFSFGASFANFSSEQLQFVSGLTFLFAVFFLICWIAEKFYEYKLKKPDLKSSGMGARRPNWNLKRKKSWIQGSRFQRLISA